MYSEPLVLHGSGALQGEGRATAIAVSGRGNGSKGRDLAEGRSILWSPFRVSTVPLEDLAEHCQSGKQACGFGRAKDFDQSFGRGLASDGALGHLRVAYGEWMDQGAGRSRCTLQVLARDRAERETLIAADRALQAATRRRAGLARTL